MIQRKRNVFISIILILIAVFFTVLVKTVDVKFTDINKTFIGFSTINLFVYKNLGVNMIWYKITNLIGLLPIIMGCVYAFIGLKQLIKRKSINKVDKHIIALGIFYMIVMAVYVFFEKIIINYRPVLIDNVLEASYPSSHTVMALCLCGSSIFISKKQFNKKFSKVLNIFTIIIMSIIIIGRLISGVHWFTDIIGGLLISSALLMCFYTILNKIEK